MIRIFIVADSDQRAEALAALLEEDERLEMTGIERADVIVCAGVSARRLPRRGKPLVAISAEADSDGPLDGTLRAWLPVGASLEEIAAAITAAASGLTILTRQQARRTFHSVSAVDEAPIQAEALTGREQEVLLMMAAGSGNKEIAARLSISPNTAKFHVAQIMAKLGATSRTQAVSTAIRRGLVPI